MATTYDDGIVDILRIVDNIANPGDMPKKGEETIARMAFVYQHIGVTRHYESLKAGETISAIIEMYQNTNISANDRAVISGKRYEIMRVEHGFNRDGIRVTTLTLGEDNET